MSAVTSVDRNCRPTVRKDLNFRLTSVNHGLNGQNHPRLQARPFAPASKVRDLGVFVHAAADTVTDELPDYTKALGLAYLLHSGRDVEETTSYLTLFDCSLQRGLGYIEEFLDARLGVCQSRRLRLRRSRSHR